MTKNVGGIDKIVRMVAGVALLGLGFMGNVWLAVIGGVLLGTALIGWCPPYALLGISTCKNS